MAQTAGLDLVEVAPQSRPPVAKILDYGRFKYEQKKKTKGKPKSNAMVTKEVRVRPKIDVNDLNIKSRKAREFLEAGNKVQVTCMFRGREMAYQSIGREVMLRLAESLEDIAKVERMPKMEGRRMHLVMSKLPPGSKPKPRAEAEASAESKADASGASKALADHLKATNNDDFADLPSVPAKSAEAETVDSGDDTENNE
ncbi:MAG: translation initiation factor IF-3 [Myxococcota bacterium]|jgi:translation initiation factor IF-3